MNHETKSSKVILLMLASFSFIIGLTEFISVGLIPLISKDLNISLSLAGLTVTVYALGVVISSPFLTSFFVHFSKKKIILGAIFVQIIGSLLCAFSVNFTMLLISRVIASLAHGFYMALASLIATQVVPENKKSFGLSLMLSGLTISMIIGVPIGTLLGDFFGWREAFFFIAALGFIVFLIILNYFPHDLKNEAKIPLRKIKEILFHKDVLSAFLLTFIGYGGSFVTFTYLSPLLSTFGHFSTNSISLVLILYGVAISVGNILGGKWTNHNTLKALFRIFLLNILILIIFYGVLHVENSFLIVVFVFLTGCFSFSASPGLQVYAVSQSEKHMDKGMGAMGSALNQSSFNLGIFSGSYLGELSVDFLPLDSLPLVGASMMTLAFFISFYLYKKSR